LRKFLPVIVITSPMPSLAGVTLLITGYALPFEAAFALAGMSARSAHASRTRRGTGSLMAARAIGALDGALTVRGAY
jgi:hypothetical protein